MLNDDYLQRLHVEMFGSVWKWAGEFRPIQTNIGVAPHRIRTDLRQLYDEVRGWIEYKSYPPDEIAVRLHYRVVTIHPFRNGNGRHARMLADIAMIRQFRVDPVPWRGSPLRNDDENRKTYITALVEADNRNFAPLLAFAQSAGR
jgi:Fic-DOC domain mobile mystery protein B